MIKRGLGPVTLALLVLCAAAQVHAGEGKSEHIKTDQLPAKVAEAFKKDHPDATIKEVEKETYADGTIHYEIEYTDKDGKVHEIEYSADGKKLEKH